MSVFVKQMCIILRASKRKLIIRWDAMEGLGHNSKCNVTYFSYLNKKNVLLFCLFENGNSGFKLVCCVRIIGRSHASVLT